MTEKKNEALVLWESQLAEDAAASAEAVAGIGGAQFFSIRGGRLTLGDTVMPNNEVTTIALCSVFENVFYEDEYDADNPSSPSCYAFAAAQADLKPHEAAPKPVHAQCKGCPNNEFGTASRGKGKACRNRIRIACLPAGVTTGDRLDPFDAAALQTEQIAYLGVPPTSLGAWASYVKSLKASLGRPPYAVYTRVRVVPDEKVQTRLEFFCAGSVASELGAAVLARREEAQAGIAQPYPEVEVAEKKPSKKRRF